MKRIIISVFVLLALAGSAFAQDSPTAPTDTDTATDTAPTPDYNTSLEWSYPKEFNGHILGFRIFHAKKSIPWGRHNGDRPEAGADMQMIQVDDPTQRAAGLVLPAGPNYIRVNAIYTLDNQVAESFLSAQVKIEIKGASTPGTGGGNPTNPRPSDLKLRNTVPTKLKAKQG